MNKKNYTVEDLLNDNSFISYIMDHDSPDGREWRVRLAQTPDLVSTANEAAEVIQSLKYQDLSFTRHEAEQIWNRIDRLTSDTHQVQMGWKLRDWVKVAAVLIPIVVSIFWLISNFQKNEGPVEMVETTITKDCPNGRKMQVTLPDGSTVKLNSGSRLTYKSSFDKDLRAVWLEGEAFFDVKRNTDKPFVIISGNIRTQVLGTSFNVKSYGEEGLVDVAVLSGLVSVSRFNESEPDRLQWDNISGVVLNPSELVSYNINEDKFSEIVEVDTDEILAWKSGILVFERATFEEIVKKLERWYGVEFEIDKSVEITDGFTGRFDNQSLRRVLEGIGYTSKFDFKIEGKKIKIMEVQKTKAPG